MSQMRIYLDSVNASRLFKEWKIYTVLVQKKIESEFIEVCCNVQPGREASGGIPAPEQEKQVRLLAGFGEFIGVKVSMLTITPFLFKPHRMLALSPLSKQVARSERSLKS